ncbi:helicase-exonuclease AddAB subunit AddA [Limosilactobacillus sp. STM2_1]|uniref:ATP-dependent helicase/nuclease subunit A n=1 Tax=Limosilactobacillus rudii TaxID=2759755 RepID=A0A7W3UJ24_9LACO|nr:helicase-exonuclease AddAB subunit AddA [Limosilactobacillus rudii]MBB1078399.1 helicase-exonuclease AddAB subunit AddA [Limosilactobacillus rudii]MBB1096529.1 helicase-exonuclease AddAB subunit AddA [Limosilactobacillus rudii]MCD7134274.1 helicase-exonuclease AddAB subunit AddA [Limosilactobacillus rudii]
MAGFKPTPAQHKAISDRNTNILVSASAGSGKTAVLVNRTIELIKEGQSIDRMLLVTFTDAAAKNMRDKIRTALQKIVQDSTKPKALRDRMGSQINRLAAADISTIHAFCLKLIKRYYYLIDLDPQFRLLTDDTERLLLQEDVWHEVSEQLYRTSTEKVAGRASFGELVLNFSNDRDDQGLDDLVLRLYDIANAQPDPEGWLQKLPDNYDLGDGEILQSAFYQDQLKPLVIEKLQQFVQDYRELAMRAADNGLDKTEEILKTDQEVISQLSSALSGIKMENVCQIMAQQKFGSFRGRPAADDPRIDVFKNIQKQRNGLKKQWEQTVSDSLGIVKDTEAVKEKVLTNVTRLRDAFVELIEKADASGLDEKTVTSLQKDRQMMQDILDLLQPPTWDMVRDLFVNAKFARLSGKPKDDDLAEETYKSIGKTRTGIKKQFDQLVEHFFTYSEKQFRTISTHAQELLKELSVVTIKFCQQYQQTKINRHVLEFSDLEHYAYAILTPPADQPNWQALVQDLQKHYQEIMIDEYQDTNRLQESILMKLTSPDRKNLFMVGDVKQSIYRFREADPTLFLGKYQDYRNGENGEAIVLGENFRSMTNVTSFTNTLFEQLMDKEVGEIDYDEDAHLKYAATYYEDNKDNHAKPTEVLLYDANATSNDKQDVDHEDDKLAGEFRMIGMRIKQMVEGQEMIFHPDDGQMHPIQYGDIVLLERTKAINNTLMEEFNKLNIPLTVHDVESYFQATEVRVMMAILKLIDNPQQDIPLAAVLRSPIVGLTNQELAFIRLQNRSADYYTALQSFVRNYDQKTLHHQSLFTAEQATQLYEKITHFLEMLKTFRQTAQQQTLVDLIWQIYDQTGYLDYVGAMPGGHQRQANLHALYQRAHTYEQSSFKGLYQFIRFIEKMQEHDKDLGVAPTQLTANTVNVMTIHGSKGLQFPVVFLIDATHGFNKGAARENAVVDAMAGVGIRYMDKERVVYDTPQRQAVIEEVQRGERAEDLRVLYVALTRAEQRLVITGSFNEEMRTQSLTGSWQRWQKAFQSNHLLIGPQPRISANSFMDWIGLALARYPEFNAKQLSAGDVTLEESALAGSKTTILNTIPDFIAKTYTFTKVTDGLATIGQDASEDTVATNNIPVDDASREKIAKIIRYRYPNIVATQTTAYQSVTDVKRVFEDPDTRDMARWDYDQQRKIKTQGMYLNNKFDVPPFIQQDNSQPAPTDIGTATHLVFQKLSLEEGMPDIQQVDSKIQQLVAERLINPQVAGQINRQGIVGFYRTSVGKEIIKHPTAYHREVPFSMIMNGHELFKGVNASDDERILIHGIIDGYLKTDKGIILVDYKTDHINTNYQEFDLARIKDRYRGQLELYKEALNIMEGVPVVQMGLYLLELGEFVLFTKEGD